MVITVSGIFGRGDANEQLQLNCVPAVPTAELRLCLCRLLMSCQTLGQTRMSDYQELPTITVEL